MYLTRLELDPQNRATMRALSNPDIFHGAIESSFPGERKRRLWRIDSLAGRRYLLLVSEDRPNLQTVQGQFGFPDRPWLTKDYQSFLDGIQPGSRLHFRLVANPTCSGPGDPVHNKRGKVYSHCTIAQQKEWLKKRSEKHGFSVSEDEFDVVHRQKISFFKSGAGHHKVFLSSVAFEGFLRVTDAELFSQLLVRGMGREKAFGMGMMTVMKVEMRK